MDVFLCSVSHFSDFVEIQYRRLPLKIIGHFQCSDVTEKITVSCRALKSNTQKTILQLARPTGNTVCRPGNGYFCRKFGEGLNFKIKSKRCILV
jgi:hypothetical protein